jgi:hypothetical protein
MGEKNAGMAQDVFFLQRVHPYAVQTTGGMAFLQPAAPQSGGPKQ